MKIFTYIILFIPIFFSSYLFYNSYNKRQKLISDTQKINDYQKVVNYLYANKSISGIDTLLNGYKFQKMNNKQIILIPPKEYWDYYGIEIVLGSNQDIIEVNPFKP